MQVAIERTKGGIETTSSQSDFAHHKNTYNCWILLTQTHENQHSTYYGADRSAVRFG